LAALASVEAIEGSRGASSGGSKGVGGYGPHSELKKGGFYEKRMNFRGKRGLAHPAPLIWKILKKNFGP